MMPFWQNGEIVSSKTSPDGSLCYSGYHMGNDESYDIGVDMMF